MAWWPQWASGKRGRQRQGVLQVVVPADDVGVGGVLSLGHARLPEERGAGIVKRAAGQLAVARQSIGMTKTYSNTYPIARFNAVVLLPSMLWCAKGTLHRGTCSAKRCGASSAAAATGIAAAVVVSCCYYCFKLPFVAAVVSKSEC